MTTTKVINAPMRTFMESSARKAMREKRPAPADASKDY
jgi:hypothetical protein